MQWIMMSESEYDARHYLTFGRLRIMLFFEQLRLHVVFDTDPGVCLVVGYIPGMDVSIVPLMTLDEEYCNLDDFVPKIQNSLPSCLMLFSDLTCHVEDLRERIYLTLPRHVPVTGSEQQNFSFSNMRLNENEDLILSGNGVSAVAVVFSANGQHFDGPAVQFHLMCSHVWPVKSPGFTALPASEERYERSQSIKATRLNSQRGLDGFEIVEHAGLQGAGVEGRYYIGVVKQMHTVTILNFYKIYGIDEELSVEGTSIRKGDRFCLCPPSVPKKSLKQSSENIGRCVQKVLNGQEIRGCFVFASRDRRSVAEPILQHAPDVPLGGMMTATQVCRGNGPGVQKFQFSLFSGVAYLLITCGS